MVVVTVCGLAFQKEGALRDHDCLKAVCIVPVGYLLTLKTHNATGGQTQHTTWIFLCLIWEKDCVWDSCDHECE